MRKKILALLIAIISITIVSCNDDSDDSNHSKLVLSSTSINLKLGESYTLNVKNYEYIKTDNDKIVVFEKISPTSYSIKGKKIGKTILDFGNGKCDVNITGNYHYFTDPYLLWGEAKDKIKGKETRELINEDPNNLFYLEKYSLELDYVKYSFSNTGLYSITLLIPYEKEQEMINWAYERFYYGSSDQNYDYYEGPELMYYYQYHVSIKKEAVKYNNKNYYQVELYNYAYYPPNITKNKVKKITI